MGQFVLCMKLEGTKIYITKKKNFGMKKFFLDLHLSLTVALLFTGGGHPEARGPDHRHLGGLSAAQQERGESAAKRAAAQGVQVQAHPVPTQGRQARQGGRLRELHSPRII